MPPALPQLGFVLQSPGLRLHSELGISLLFVLIVKKNQEGSPWESGSADAKGPEAGTVAPTCALPHSFLIFGPTHSSPQPREVGTYYPSLMGEDSGHREAEHTQGHADGKRQSRTQTQVSPGAPCFFIAVMSVSSTHWGVGVWTGVESPPGWVLTSPQF